MPRVSRTFAFGTLLVGLAVFSAAGCGRKPTNEAPNVAISPNQPIVEVRADEPDQVRSADQLRQIGVAWLSYPDANDHYPYPGSKDPKSASAGLSWRVMVLPFIEEVKLYNEFHLNEPWDSEHNKKLIPKMPACYASGGLKREDGKTRYRTIAGPNCVVPIAAPNGPHPAPRKPSEIIDGSANTLAVVETDESVIWTKPDEVRLDQPRAKLLQWKDGSVLAVFLNGEVRTAPAPKLTDDVFRRYATHNGGESLAGADVWTVLPRRPRTAEEKNADEEFQARRAAVEKKFAGKKAALEADNEKRFAEYTRTVAALNREETESRAQRDTTLRLIARAKLHIETSEAENAKTRSEQQLVTAEIKKFAEMIELDNSKLKTHEAALSAATVATKTARERADRTKRTVAEAKSTFDDLTKKHADEKDPTARQALAKKLRVADDALKDLVTLDAAERSACDNCEKQLAELTGTKNKLLEAVRVNKLHIELDTELLGRLTGTEREQAAKAQAARTELAGHERTLKTLDARRTAIDAELRAAEARWAEHSNEYQRLLGAIHREEGEALFPPDKK